MPSYRYRAVHETGRIASGVATARNEIELAQLLGGAQLELIEAREKKNKSSHTWPQFLSAPVSQRALALFCAQMTDLLKAGVPLLDGITDLTAVMSSGALRDSLNDIARSLRHGSRIAPAFARHPQIYPSVFVAILASGEASGDIMQAFEQLTGYVESRARMNEHFKRALRYPLFLMAVAFAVVTFMMVLVVPQIVAFLNSIDTQLPPATRFLIKVSHLFSEVWWLLALCLGSSVVATIFLRRLSPRAACFIDSCVLSSPIFGDVILKLMLARFAQCFSILVQSGLNIPESLKGARDTLGNRALETKLDQVLQRIISGDLLSNAMNLLFPPFALRILKIGEQGRGLPKSLADIARHYDREATESAERMIGMLEPGLTLMIGALLAWVVLAVLGPIYGSLSHMNVMG